MGCGYQHRAVRARIDLAAMTAQCMNIRMERCVEPMAASVESAPVISADWTCAVGAKQTGKREAVETCVPLISARPSLAASTTGSSPASASPRRPASLA